MRVGLLLLLAGLCACEAKDAELASNRTKVAATSTADAQAAVADSTLGFKLEKPGPAWKMLAARDAAGVASGAVAGGLGPSSVVGTVGVSALDGDLAAHVKTMAERLGLEGLAVTMGNQRTEGEEARQYFDVTGKAAGIALDYDGIAVAKGGVVYELLAWAPADAKEAAAPKKAFLDAFALAGEAPKPSALPKRDPAAVDHAGVGKDWALRAGKYRDFTLALSVAPPKGWTLAPGASARRVNPDARLHLHHPELGLHAVLVGKPVDSELDGKGFHEAVLARAKETVGLTASKAQAAKLGDGEALVSTGTATVKDASLHYRIYTGLHNAHGLQLVTWGAAVDGKPSRAPAEPLDALAKSVTLEVTLPAVETTISVHQDHRMGYTLTIPAGWIRKELPSPVLEASGSLIRWDRQGRSITVLAVSTPGSTTRQGWMLSFLEQLMREQLSLVSPGTATAGAATLGGQEATRLTWQAAMHRADAFLLHAQGVAYAVVTVDHGAEASEGIERSFALLP